ncbi:EKC/KEOPS complex subunit GON7 [Suricata suricatta]|uniref:GON7 subunit of KEOPS complex n=1 Tax=Suricata suricatta TaxID=37032 RepID=A0A673UEV0_SURSU|nr:EKC/KEOPS complex subunit GON7 [Suricata suricatta]
MELLAEYIGPGGQQHQLRVPCEVPADADPYETLLSALAHMRELVVELLDPLVEQEAQDRGAAAPEEALDGDDEDDGEDENNTDDRTNSDGPSAKRPKPPS